MAVARRVLCMLQVVVVLHAPGHDVVSIHAQRRVVLNALHSSVMQLIAYQSITQNPPEHNGHGLPAGDNVGSLCDSRAQQTSVI
jgi:hypothetical protein